MAVVTWLKGEICLFWLDKDNGARKYFPSISIDFIKWGKLPHPALIKLQGMLPDAFDFFRNLKADDTLQLLCKKSGLRNEYDKDEVFVTFDVNKIKSKWMFNPIVSNPDLNNPLDFYMKIECNVRYEKT